MIRFVLVIFCLVFDLSSYAGSRLLCDRLLSSSALTSEVSAADSQLSGAAQAYVNLIQLYIGPASSSRDMSVVDQILNSKQFINPFIGNKSSTSVQFLSAIERIKSSISSKDWPQIQILIRSLADKKNNENNDRIEKKKSSADIFNPKTIEQIDHEKEYGSVIWHSDGERLLIAANADDKKLVVYELVGKRLKVILEFDTDHLIENLSFRVIDSQLYIALVGRFQTTDKDKVQISLYSLNEKKVTLRTQLETHEKDLAWAKDKPYFAAFRGSKVSVYQITSTEVVNVSNSFFSDRSTQISYLSWHFVKGRVFIFVKAITQFDGRYPVIALFELKDNKLTLADEQTNTQYGRPRGVFVNQLSEEDDLLELGAYEQWDDSVFVFKIVNGKIKVFKKSLKNSKLMPRSNDSKVITVSAFSRTDNFELRGNTLRQVTKSIEMVSGTSFSWQNVDGQDVFAGYVDKALVFYSLEANEIIKRARLPVLMMREGSPVWIKHGQDVYVLANICFGFDLIKVMNPPKGAK